MKITHITFKSSPTLVEQLKNNVDNRQNIHKSEPHVIAKKSQSKNGFKKRKYAVYAAGTIVAAGGVFAFVKRKNIFEFFKKLFNLRSGYTTQALKPDNIDTSHDLTPIGKQIEKNLQEVREKAQILKDLQAKSAQQAENSVPQTNLATAFENNEVIKKVVIKDPVKSPQHIFVSRVYEKLKTNVQEFKSTDYTEASVMEVEVAGALKNIGEDESLYKTISLDFGADALVANRDILKSCRIDKDKRILRFDLSQTLGSKADKTKEYFGTVVEELSDFFNAEKYPDNAKVYSLMLRDDLIKSLQKITANPKSDFNSYSLISGLSKTGDTSAVGYRDILRRRRNFLTEFLNQLQNTPQNELSMAEYTRLVKINTIKAFIDKAESLALIKDLQQSIKNIDDANLSQELQTLLDKKISALTSDHGLKITQYMTDLIFEKYKNGYPLTDVERNTLKEKYGSYAGRIEYALKQNLDDIKLFKIFKIMSQNNGKYFDFWKNNPDKMILYINSKAVSDGQLYKFGDKEWDFVIKNFKTFCERDFDKKTIDALLSYSGLSGYDQINGYLRSNYKIDSLLEKLNNINKFGIQDALSLKEEIFPLKFIVSRFYMGKGFEECGQNSKVMNGIINDILNILESKNAPAEKEKIVDSLKNLKAFINKIAQENGYVKKIELIENYATTSAKEDKSIVLKRIETDMGLDTLRYNGESLATYLSNRNLDSLPQRVLDYLNETKPVIYQPGFLSTSISPYETLAGNVKMKLKLGANVKYNYISDIDHILGNTGESTEAEVLINPGHFIKISDIKKAGNKLYLYGEILPQGQI